MARPERGGGAERRKRLSRGGFSALAGLLLVLAAGSCAPGPRTAQDTLLRYMRAVQDEDLPALFCMSAGATRAEELGVAEEEREGNFQTWAREWYRVYQDGRDTGRVEIGEHGIVLVKLFALGRGTFYDVVGTRAAGPGTMEVDTRLRFGYSGIDLSRFSPGTTFYLCGSPPGVVHPVLMEPHKEVSLEVLETVTVRWTLVREEASGGCPERWTVASAAPLDEGFGTERITWVF